MGNDQEKLVENSRRNWLIATSVVGGVATLIPFVGYLQPSEHAKASGAPVEVDISRLRSGEKMTVNWRGLPVWIVWRTSDDMDSLEKVKPELVDPESKEVFSYPMPEFCNNAYRARIERKDLLVVIGICTHLGCIPLGPYVANSLAALGTYPGFLCPCHGSTYDMSGRVFKNNLASKNLDIPRFMFLSETKIVIGQDEKGES
ncbi:ubiquinol-cytochrome c reductase iron-sulfur subunit [Candidatus Pandoraea novymonadis]|uniref:Ubiquinol-cytochrome c reductase iron-sulfur subunit n=1 Tax=Candidatus Pandoraea novymonadis TaxID=1808959 RepID=A0ABX5FF01_9BURK|nr:ubiquinol-cytochrome c reductase iron-sulfur subunit [Candidatus Pandoraea novymonadis]PSB91592.1 Ubiquinol-cytochrome c reductase iron-sulfur subunit [Candidatus Pandoraea novymonadis]